ncbi:type II toxin-antitoxin system VapB family antitoxin [Sphingomonas sp. HITSZ_GF]|uniref:type II toxin-antitoxin system VapB family antitoxin n=1 Tax=Sphingomonas sp. HITSZ_GF TaxID=3037247 RepID=UPI00240D5DE6|nr:type II toxin-antitoxin system VapB family antitoxin [Sphingomonas sp. HITSZ_GF]MDG2535613.1 type II toxin-antitoxin system VapB family antitoxin [Sphingomonas sp. HITSZ_GF]
MGKYEPLADFLHKQTRDHWSASFEEVEAVLGFYLPNSARKHAAWWANQHGEGHSQTSWLDAGWNTSNVDLKKRRVDFVRVRSATPSKGEHALLEQARALTGIPEQEEVIREALRALIERENARRLIALGGTMPYFAAPARRRSAA